MSPRNFSIQILTQECCENSKIVPKWGIFKIFGWGDLFKLDQPFFFQQFFCFSKHPIFNFNRSKSFGAQSRLPQFGSPGLCDEAPKRFVFFITDKDSSQERFFEKYIGVFFGGSTLPETNIAPARRPVQKEISLPTIIFRCYVC